MTIEDNSTKFQCPRRGESHFGSSPEFARDNDYDPLDDTCSHCGSLNPETLMARLEAGDVTLGSTDKSYKVYVENDGGSSFKQSYRDCPQDKEMTGINGNKYMVSSCDKGPDFCTHWITRETPGTKFYFQHLSGDQKKHFIQLFNDKRIKFQGGYGFYVLPFFISKSSDAR